MKKPMRIIEKYLVMQKLGMTVEAPYNVWTFFGDTAKQLEVFGDNISFGCDYKSLNDSRKAVEWVANQLGGKIDWTK